MLREYPTIMIKIDRFLGQFSAVLCTALHQWVEVSYVTKWFHHQQNIFCLRIITMIWPNLKDHNSNFLDASLLAVLKISWKNVTCSVISPWRLWRNSFMERAKVAHHLLKSSTQKCWLFGWRCDRSREGFCGLFGWCCTDFARKGWNHMRTCTTIGRRFNVSPAKKNTKYSLCWLVSNSKTSHPGELF